MRLSLDDPPNTIRRLYEAHLSRQVPTTRSRFKLNVQTKPGCPEASLHPKNLKVSVIWLAVIPAFGRLANETICGLYAAFTSASDGSLKKHAASGSAASNTTRVLNSLTRRKNL